MRYISKQEALSSAIEKILKSQNGSIRETLGPLSLRATLKVDNTECHDDELENCFSGSFSVEVRQVTSTDPEISVANNISGRFSEVLCEYRDGQHHFVVGSVSIP